MANKKCMSKICYEIFSRIFQILIELQQNPLFISRKTGVQSESKLELMGPSTGIQSPAIPQHAERPTNFDQANLLPPGLMHLSSLTCKRGCSDHSLPPSEKKTGSQTCEEIHCRFLTERRDGMIRKMKLNFSVGRWGRRIFFGLLCETCWHFPHRLMWKLFSLQEHAHLYSQRRMKLLPIVICQRPMNYCSLQRASAKVLAGVSLQTNLSTRIRMEFLDVRYKLQLVRLNSTRFTDSSLLHIFQWSKSKNEKLQNR